MVPNGLLKFLSVFLVIAVIAMVVVEKSEGLSWDSLLAQVSQSIKVNVVAEGQTDLSGDDESSASSESLSNEPAVTAAEPSGVEESDSASVSGERLVVGVMGATPAIDQIHSIAAVPWLESEINRAFNQSADSACQLLLPDTPVKPPLTRQPVGRRGVMGRMAALTVGLEIDSAAELKLPQASSGAIRGYLSDHRLAIEPIVFQDEQGKPYFGTDCRAAFYPVAYPTSTVKSEPMIEDAIGRFRAIGILREGSTADGRTLVMAFRYVDSSAKEGLITAKPRDVTELLFLHLSAGSTDKLPLLEVFATSDSRQNLHRLTVDGASVLQDPQATISASIRFDSFVLMGLYPAKPVVTGIRQRSSGVISFETIKKLTTASDEKDRMTFQSLLDQFASLTQA